jgi:hypothetical protein
VETVTNDNTLQGDGNKAETVGGVPFRYKILGGVVCKYFGAG